LQIPVPLNPPNEDFMREAEIMKELKHPYIVGYFGHTVIDNFLCILMEYMPGITFLLNDM